MTFERASLGSSLLLAFGLLGGCVGGIGASAVPTALSHAFARAGSERYGAYEWNAGDAVARWKAGSLWSQLRAKSVDDLLLGFDDAQIATYARPSGARRMNALIADAAKHDVRVELLLGDPGWILPAGVANLETILRRLHAVRFAGLNLDLEPNELHGLPRKVLFDDLVAAMRSYVAASPWSVSLDLSDAFAGTPASGSCLVCRLERAGLTRVVLMTYVADPVAVARIDRPILAGSPHLAFSIAQDVEPPSVVGSPRDTYWKAGYLRFHAAMVRLNALMRASPNYTGIVVQSMSYLATMKAGA